MKSFLTVVVTIAVCLTASAQAQNARLGRLQPSRDANMGYKDGMDVLRICTSSADTEIQECTGFLEGVSDLLVADRKAQGLPDCYPAGKGTVDQMAIQQAFIGYMIAHPERRPEQGATAVKAAIEARWCTR